MMENKKAFRDSVLDKISALSDEYIRESNDGIFRNFLSLSEYKNAATIFAYISEKREPDTVKIIHAALSSGKRVALPVSLPGGIMEPRLIADLDELVPGRFGIPAPPDSAPLVLRDEIDMIIVPAVTFDANGYRLGRGGGYYDRFLAGSAAFSVGLGRQRLIMPVPLESHDMNVNCLITESAVYKF